ncbi:hypothetical protein DSL72_006889 [Monilinia vaccinii-corymbosi]|uniref:Uncharacterized protein n=1 Tax=Monilinia vaccinii-corymbosi TaxID=61207 RepID=A0A8A3PK39_9HELO|nr:hypothetical protein DSL72_006889 [Monilinia vaccinii-corymbosi]
MTMLFREQEPHLLHHVPPSRDMAAASKIAGESMRSFVSMLNDDSSATIEKHVIVEIMNALSSERFSAADEVSRPSTKALPAHAGRMTEDDSELSSQRSSAVKGPILTPAQLRAANRRKDTTVCAPVTLSAATPPPPATSSPVTTTLPRN